MNAVDMVKEGLIWAAAPPEMNARIRLGAGGKRNEAEPPLYI
jgi:hypothetical protein